MAVQTVFDRSTGAVFLFDDPNALDAAHSECSVHIWRSDDMAKTWRFVRAENRIGRAEKMNFIRHSL